MGRYQRWRSTRFNTWTLININDFLSDLTSNPKIFADDTSMIAAVKDMTVTANEMNGDLKK